MSWKRIPHQFVLCLAFTVVAIGLAVAIVKSTLPALRETAASIAYARGELAGISYLGRVHAVLHELLDCRSDIERAQIQLAMNRVASSATDDAAGGWTASISTAIAAVPNQSSPKTDLDRALSEAASPLEERWLATLRRSHVTAQNLSAVIAEIQPLLVSISGASGLSNDPTAEGQNFTDAILRFPFALAYGADAGSMAVVNMAAGRNALGERVAAARLLAEAETAIDVGRQDADDEMSIDPRATEFLARSTAAVRDFTTMKRRITQTYVEAGKRPRAANFDRAFLVERQAFTASSVVVIDLLRENLIRTLTARIEQGQERHWRLLAGSIAGLGLEFVIMLTLALISSLSYLDQRKRMAAERHALEAQRAALEVQLTHAKAEQALLHVKAQFRAVFDRAPTGMIIVDRSCRVLDINDAAQAILQASDEAITAAGVIGDLAPAIERIFADALDLHAQEHCYTDRANQPHWVHVSISPVRDESGPAQIVILMIRDITDSKRMEAQLVFEAGHDGLTGLPNRNNFLRVLQQALDARRHSDLAVFSVVFIDFNDFKTINDGFGHQAGDRFLIDAASRLRESVRSTDCVARIGGDEFAVLLHGADRREIERSVTRLQSVVSVPVDIEGQLVASSASFGIAEAELSYSIAADIVRDADTAMYQAKAQGGRNYVVFDMSMRDRVVRRMQLSIDIVHALEHRELELWYQPIVDLRDGKVAGCEALVRWRRADGSLISPAEFLPLAEENGSIIEIGRWVTSTACEQMQSWNDRSAAGGLAGLRDGFVIHVNLAIPEVRHVDLLPHLQQTLARTNVAREQIILEITEGIVLENTATMRATLDALSEDGFRLCIDDFGTGYSSLRYLNDLPLHCFKIDRAFVSNGSPGLANASIVDMLLVLSRSLELSVVAEGIETREQWDQLRDLGCRYGQGYLFAPALDGHTFTTVLERDAMPSIDGPAMVGLASGRAA